MFLLSIHWVILSHSWIIQYINQESGTHGHFEARRVVLYSRFDDDTWAWSTLTQQWLGLGPHPGRECVPSSRGDLREHKRASAGRTQQPRPHSGGIAWRNRHWRNCERTPTVLSIWFLKMPILAVIPAQAAHSWVSRTKGNAITEQGTTRATNKKRAREEWREKTAKTANNFNCQHNISYTGTVGWCSTKTKSKTGSNKKITVHSQRFQKTQRGRASFWRESRRRHNYKQDDGRKK